MFASFLIQAHEDEDHIVIQKKSLSLDNTQVSKGTRKILSIAKGQRVELNIANMCDGFVEACNTANLSVIRDPAEGILFPLDAEGHAIYQHAGTSDITDEIIFLHANSDSDVSYKLSVVLEIINTSTKLVILSPTSGFQTSKRYVTVSYKITGNNFDHLHMSLNDAEHISIDGRGGGSHTFNNLPLGKNRIDVNLARKDHRQIPGSGQTLIFEVIR